MTLTDNDIAKYAARKGAKPTAVWNFLGTLDAGMNLACALGNLAMDARLYKWNAATVGAIRAGIIKKFG